ncbi:hypothetical protein [Candidatus Uabimicrobium sp. HlEnr_7]|uniref:hypothetical protein n=1 Tax=Candidatus Uabimicrobium helgolandensis TaxID=3095367 RepID=UPI003557CFD8
MQNKDTLFAKKVLELNIIRNKDLKKCQLFQQNSIKQGTETSLSQVAVSLKFITQQQANTIEKFIAEQKTPANTKIQLEIPQNNPINHSAKTNNSVNAKNQFSHYIIEEKLGLK